MPNINDVFPSKYLKVSDLDGHEPIVTIERVEWEPVGRDREMKAVVYFAGKKKAIVLNKTMATKLTEITGSSMTEAWIGHKVQLFAAEANYGGDTYDVVRIKAVKKPTSGSAAQAAAKKPNGTPKPKPAPPPPVSDVDADEFNEIDEDAIPF